MLAIEFPEANFVYKKPSHMTDEQCSDLCVWRGSTVIESTYHPVPAIISCWKLSVEDLEEINKNGVLWLTVIGNIMPPVSIDTENPF